MHIVMTLIIYMEAYVFSLRQWKIDLICSLLMNVFLIL